ncbi:hypothetical protein EOK75_06610 [Pseudorhodobacter turbinis]|uniref:Uncharacterized protein n=1 Tax=Pseudorhodobacter turbinis TaxID=2500533 RepID=A0A4P8EG23_9RHOB|nr:hypothetical protein EOK75_06610 [Pseudorhodobacter turbinis]
MKKQPNIRNKRSPANKGRFKAQYPSKLGPSNIRSVNPEADRKIHWPDPWRDQHIYRPEPPAALSRRHFEVDYPLFFPFNFFKQYRDTHRYGMDAHD